jgi:DNA-binding transcriptional MerR regulator
MDRFLSPSETARRFGVTTKALRLYERHGLIAPVRSASGWRTYGPAQVTRLVQILALKRLGLPLARIAQLLAGRDDLGAVLALQEDVLAHDSQRLSRALAVVRDARQRLAEGAILSIDDLATLAKETVMSRLNHREMNRILMPFADRHLSPADKDAVRAKVADREQFAKDIDALMGEAQALMQAGDHTSPAAQDMARRFRALTRPFMTDDPEALAKYRAVWADAQKDDATAAKLALNRQILVFMEQAMAHLKANEAQ